MNFSPSREAFLNIAKNHDVVAVSAKFTTDSETPLSAYSKLSGEKPAFLFESVVGGEQLSRYSLWVVTLKNNLRRAFSNYNCREGKNTEVIPTPKDPLALVEQCIDDIRYYGPEIPQRFSGGAVGYLSYEYANRIESSIPTRH